MKKKKTNIKTEKDHKKRGEQKKKKKKKKAEPKIKKRFQTEKR